MQIIDRSTDVLSALRLATRERHDFIDGEMPLSKESPSLSDFRDHLLILRVWLTPLEHWLGNFTDGPQKEEYMLRSERIALIDDDLAYLSEQSLTRPVSFPFELNLNALSNSPCYRWGVCYVIEGSQLGGAVLQKRFAALFATHPFRYLSADNTQPAERWLRFIGHMRNEVKDEADILQACEGACYAFDYLVDLHRAQI